LIAAVASPANEASDKTAAAAGLAEGQTVRVISHVFEARDPESLKQLAQALIDHPGTIALLGSRDKEFARLVFARSTDSPGDMNALMREACATIHGRGGGNAEMAQGGGKDTERVSEAIAGARARIRGTDNQRVAPLDDQTAIS
jgi:alanyl-tRNA synthetase